MADEEAETKKGKVSDEEVRASFAGPAFHSNKMYASAIAAGLRLAFMEQLGDKVPPAFRTAVLLAYPDALALRDLLSRQLEDIERQLKEAEAAAKKELANSTAAPKQNGD